MNMPRNELLRNNVPNNLCFSCPRNSNEISFLFLREDVRKNEHLICYEAALKFVFYLKRESSITNMNVSKIPATDVNQ